MSLRRVSIWLAILAVPLWFAAQQMEGFTYTLKYRDVRSVLARVTEDLGKNGQVWIDGAANRITVQDDSSHMNQIRRLIQSLDQPARHFAMDTRMDILPDVPSKSLFKPTPSFVDMTQWSATVAPRATYRVRDGPLRRGGRVLLSRDFVRSRGQGPGLRSFQEEACTGQPVSDLPRGRRKAGGGRPGRCRGPSGGPPDLVPGDALRPDASPSVEHQANAASSRDPAGGALMPKFKCRLGTSGGDVVVQELVAPSENALRVQLEDKGYFIFSIKSAYAWQMIFEDMSGKGTKIRLRDFIVFNQEFSALLKAGLPVLTSLNLLLSRTREKNFQRMLTQVRDDVQSGASLSEAFSNRGKVFPSIYPATLAAGERSGELVSVIQRYLFYLKTIQAIRKKIASAIIYPIILLTLAVALIFLLLTVIVPKFAMLFTGAGAKLPALTRAVLSVSAVFQYGWPFFLGAAIAVPVTLRLINARPGGRLFLAGIRMKVPMLGMNIKRYNISQMCRTLGTLVAGGIPIVTALDVVSDAMGNEVYKVELRRVKRQVQEGQSLWSSMEKTRMMTPMAVEMVEVGESTGALAEMLDQVSQFYDEELSTAVERFVALLEPMLLLVMAVIIAIVVLSVYMPLFSMYNMVGN